MMTLSRTMRAAARAACLLLLLCAVAPATAARAPQALTTATLGGHVEDARGAAVAGALIRLTHAETNQRREAVSDAEGRYRLTHLPVGAYQLTVSKEGFAALEGRFTLTVGQALVVTLTLTVSGVTESVEVAAGVTMVESSRTQVSETVSPREIDALPLNGRHYLDLALLTPGASRPNTGAAQRFAETSAVPGAGLSLSGQRNLNNSFVLDGLSANDDAAGLAATFYSQEVVREFQVVTSGGLAEFGRASSGVVNIITHSGTNHWRGRLYGFLRDQRLDARHPLAPRKDPLTQAQYGASLGGPLRRDRTFFFTNFEQTRRHDATVVTISEPQARAINARLDATGFGGPRLSTGLVAGGFDSTNLFARLDHQLAPAHLLTGRYSLYDLTAVNSRTVGGLNDASRGTGLSNRDQTLTGALVSTLSPAAVNELRFQLTRSRLAAPVNDPRGPAVNISGVASFGTATFSPTGRETDLFEAVDNLSSQRGAHALKAGADFLLNRTLVNFPGALQSVYTFSSMVNFLAGRYVTFQQAFGEAGQFQSNPNLGLFVQDEWRPRHDLTVQLGLRYDAQLLPAPVTTDGNNIAPRLGVAFVPGGGRTVVRAGFGLYYDRLPLRAISNALQRDGSKYRVAVLSFGQTGAPIFPSTLDAFPEGLLASVTTIDPRIENSYAAQASLQVERELPRGVSLAVGYTGLRGKHLILSRNVNVPRFPASAGVPNLGRPDPRFANVGRFESSGESEYDGLTVSLNRRASGWASLRLSYTLSKATDNAGSFFFFTPQDNSDLRGERGPSDNDQRHRLVLSGAFEAPATANGSRLRRELGGWQLSYIFSYGSALPFTVLTGTDSNFDTNANDRPGGVGRNSARGFNSVALDLRLARRFRLTERVTLEAIAEGFNLLNRANLQLPNNVFGTGSAPLPNFGRPTAAADPRQIQLGLRLNF